MINTNSTIDVLNITYDSVVEILSEKLYVIAINNKKKIYGLKEYSKINNIEIEKYQTFIGNEIILFNLTSKEEQNTRTILIYTKLNIIESLKEKYLYAYRHKSFDVFLGRHWGSMCDTLLVINSQTGDTVCKQACLSVSITPDNKYIYFNTWNYGNGSELKYILDSGDIISFDEYMGLR